MRARNKKIRFIADPPLRMLCSRQSYRFRNEAYKRVHRYGERSGTPFLNPSRSNLSASWSTAILNRNCSGWRSWDLSQALINLAKERVGAATGYENADYKRGLRRDARRRAHRID